ncbi:MAG TPA: glycosyltransferase [Candidatus Saccharimonadales bacterium]|nr:glycosyltransferase [Candidatus Saccharimonadales bacterium]
MTDFLFYLITIVGLINMAHIGLYITGANIYDVWQLRRRASKKPRRGLRPVVTIIVPAHNEALVIERCLESIRKNTYRKVEVIVHDDRSTDSTAKIVRAYKKQYPKLNLRLVSRRKQVGKAGGMNYCIKHHASGELIMSLDADCMLRRDAVKRAVDYFEDKRIVGVAANVRLLEKRTALGVLQRFEHLIGYRSKKFYTVTNCEFIVGGVASTYRRSVLQKVGYYDTDTTTEDIGVSMKIVSLGNQEHRIVYASDVVATTEGAHSFQALLKQRYRWKMGSLQNLIKHSYIIGMVQHGRYSRSLTWYRLPMAYVSELILLVQPFLLTYILVLSIQAKSPAVFVGAYVTITLYTLWTILPDEHSTGKAKLAMATYAPVLYFFFYIMDLIQIISVVRCLMHPKQLIRQTTNQSTWVSPERIGQQTQFS